MPHNVVLQWFRLARLPLVIGVMLAGCASEPPGTRDVVVPTIILAGAHYLWVDERTVEAEGYLINPGERVDLEGFTVTGELVGTEVDLPPTETRPHGADWAQGEIRKWSARFPEAQPVDQYLVVEVTDPDFWRYVTDCTTPTYQPATTCRPSNTAVITPERERELWPLLQECCNWTPSTFDIHGLDCRLGEGRVSCTGNVTNWRDASREATGEIVLQQISLTTGRPEELARGSFDLGGPYGLHETRPFTATLDLPVGLALSPGHTHQVEAIVTDEAEHAGWANETVLLTFAEVP